MPRYVCHIALGIIYHPPNADNATTLAHILQCLDTISQDHPYCGIMLTGDFNCMKDHSILSYPLKQVVKLPTRKNNILDKIFTNLSDWYNKPESLPPIGNSDHNTIIMRAKHQHAMPRKVGTIYSTVRSNDSNGKILLAHALNDWNWSNLYAMDTCQEMLQYFYMVVSQLLDTFLPLRVVKRNAADKPWINEKFRLLVKHRQYAWTHNNITEYKIYRNKVQRMATKLKANYYKRCSEGLRNSNPRNWWQHIKRLTNQSSRNDHLNTLADNQFDGDINRMADGINAFLQSVSADLLPISEELFPPAAPFTPFDFIIHPYQVERKLAMIDPHKSSGPDEIPNWFFKEFSVWLAEPVCAIFNASIREGEVPSLWKQANVVPIPKVHPPTDITKDLRPISLTPTLSKILESFIGNWTLQQIREKLDKKQYGCLKGRSTTHELVDILHHWHQALDKHQSVRAVFIDYAKAFDHVDHSTVIAKLRVLGVSDIILRWICSFLKDRQQRVKLSKTLSDWITLTGAMPQGSFLGPLIFIVLIDDLAAPCLIHKFVDDTTLSEVLNKNQNSLMPDYFQEILDWSSSNLMNINFNKTKEMILGSLKNDPPAALEASSNIIERVHTYKLLGVTLNDKLKWDNHVHSICSKASSRLYFLKLLKRSRVSIADLQYFYISIVRPVLEYACQVWHSSLTKEQSTSIEKIQKRR